MRQHLAKQLSNDDLRRLYAFWSEEVYRAGWMNGGASEFVDWLLHSKPLPTEKWEDYERTTIRAVRELIEAAA